MAVLHHPLTPTTVLLLIIAVVAPASASPSAVRDPELVVREVHE